MGGSLLGDLIDIFTGTKNLVKGKGYVSDKFDPTPVKNSPRDGCMKYLIEGTAHKYGYLLREKFVVFADSPLEAKQKFEAMFRQMHDWSDHFSCRILKSWPTRHR